MKELAEDFKSIAKKDRNLFWWMTIDFLLSLWLFLIPFFNINSGVGRRPVWYSDITSYHRDGEWYLISFSIIAVVLGIGHILLAARLYSKRGKDIARLFLAISIIIAIIGIRFLLNILGEG